jgi:hypothetical protein
LPSTMARWRAGMGAGRGRRRGRPRPWHPRQPRSAGGGDRRRHRLRQSRHRRWARAGVLPLDASARAAVSSRATGMRSAGAGPTCRSTARSRRWSATRSDHGRRPAGRDAAASAEAGGRDAGRVRAAGRRWPVLSDDSLRERALKKCLYAQPLQCTGAAAVRVEAQRVVGNLARAYLADPRLLPDACAAGRTRFPPPATLPTTSPG